MKKLTDMPIGVPFPYRYSENDDDCWAVRLNEYEFFAITFSDNHAGVYENDLWIIDIKTMDWVEIDSSSEPQPTDLTMCKCDFHSVVLRYGCKCGGK